MIPQFNISNQTAIRTRATGEGCWQLKLPSVIEPYKNQRQTTANHSDAHAGGLSERHTPCLSAICRHVCGIKGKRRRLVAAKTSTKTRGTLQKRNSLSDSIK
jgi:hypothetical protein